MTDLSDITTPDGARSLLSPSVRVDPFIEAVRAKLHARSQVGLIKYGIGLDRADLDQKAWLLHLQEELLDAAAYIERLLSYEP